MSRKKRHTTGGTKGLPYLCTVPDSLGLPPGETPLDGRVRDLLRDYLHARGKDDLTPLLDQAAGLRLRRCGGTPGRLAVYLTRRPEPPAREPDLPAPKPSGVIYADGACEAGVMGIGVRSADFGIDVSERLPQAGTNNVAECLALIRALEISRERGIAGAEYRSDSQLVVRWVHGTYRQTSPTARTYTPVIRRLLEEVRGRLVWVPGSTNQADANSRRQVGGGRPTFRQLATMRSGRDQYSRLRLPALAEQVGEEATSRARAALGDEGAVASCLRWVLRGLDLDTAIRKVRVDQEIAERAKARAYDDADLLDG